MTTEEDKKQEEEDRETIQEDVDPAEQRAVS